MKTTPALELRNKIRRSGDNRLGDRRKLLQWYRDTITKDGFILQKYRQDSTPGNVYGEMLYVLYGHKNKLYKIGVTEDRLKRYKAIGKASGSYVDELIFIELLPKYDESARIVEAALHCFFDKKRVLGEWFDLSIADVLAIKKLLWQIEGEYIQEYDIRLQNFFIEYSNISFD